MSAGKRYPAAHLMSRDDEYAKSSKQMIFELFARKHILNKLKAVYNRKNHSSKRQFSVKFKLELAELKKDQDRRMKAYVEKVDSSYNAIVDQIKRFEKAAKDIASTKKEHDDLYTFWNRNLAHTAKGVVVPEFKQIAVPPSRSDFSDLVQTHSEPAVVASINTPEAVASRDAELKSLISQKERIAKIIPGSSEDNSVDLPGSSED